MENPSKKCTKSMLYSGSYPKKYILQIKYLLFLMKNKT